MNPLCVHLCQHRHILFCNVTCHPHAYKTHPAWKIVLSHLIWEFVSLKWKSECVYICSCYTSRSPTKFCKCNSLPGWIAPCSTGTMDNLDQWNFVRQWCERSLFFSNSIKGHNLSILFTLCLHLTWRSHKMRTLTFKYLQDNA